MAIVADPTPGSADEFGFIEVEPTIDWETIAVLVLLLSIASVIALVISWALHQSVGHWPLRWRSAFASGVSLVALIVFIALTPFVTSYSAMGATHGLLGISMAGYVYLYLMLVLSWFVAFGLGWKLRRQANSRANLDPTVFN